VLNAITGEKRMRLVRRHALAPVLAALALLCASAAPAQQIEWSKWYAGAGLGPGLNAHYRQDGRTLDFDEGMPGATDKSQLGAYRIDGGVQLDPKTLVGLALSGVGKTAKINGNDASTSITNFLATATYFPAGRGFFVRAGLGYSGMVVDDGVDQRRTGGIGVLAGLGWMWNVVSQHYVTLSVDQSFQFYRSNSDHRPTRSEFSAAYLGYMYRH
jgi:outer membrane protein with beta-barrel domain